MEGILINKRAYETPEVEIVDVTIEDNILVISNYDGALTD